MSFICWNAWGLGSPRAFRNLSLLVKQHKPCLLFVIETKLGAGSSSSFKSRLSFDNVLEIPRRGLGGGLFLFWTAAVDVQINNYSSNHVDYFVSMNDNINTKWHLSCFYGSPYISNKMDTWTLLHRMYDIAPSMPWFIFGDFNDYLTLNDRSNASNPPVYAMTNFQHFLNKYNLLPLPYIGNRFTWKHGNSFERLDWCIVNNFWLDLFPKVSLHHLGFFGSDHRALKVILEDNLFKSSGSRRFMCENFRISEPDFLSVVKDGWGNNFSNLLNADPLSSFLLKIKSLQDRLESLLSCQPHSDFNSNQAKELQSQIDSLLFKEEVFWKQRSRINWLKAGDKNTKYFHSKANSRRRNNLIRGIVLDSGEHIDSQQDISKHFLNFYSTLFTSQGSNVGAVDQLLQFIPNRLCVSAIQQLDESFNSDEVKDALLQMAGDKAPANRLKNVLNDIISPNQSAFIKNVVIFDNVFIANEMVNAITHRKLGKVGWAALKLDMENAFDRVEWGFVKAIMQHLCFPVRFVNLILSCLSSVSFRLLINGSLTEKFSSSRGIRQGNPLSPYIFLLVSEALSVVIRLQEHDNYFQGISICRSAPPISHLLFADNSLLFSTTTARSCLAIKAALDLYHQATGQLVNFSKSSVLFSPNTCNSEAEFSRRTLGLDNKPFISKYLGIPQFFGRSKKEHFNFFLQKASSKLSNWTNRLFSRAGKEVLLKVVIQLIPSYAMSCFRVPVSVCKRIERLMAQFWWGSSGNQGKVHWNSWDKLCQSKFLGGMGFRSFVCHNQAFLAKQAWRVFSMPNSLLAKLLKAKYFSHNSFLEASKGHCASFTWRSLLWGGDLLKRGLIWKVGNGRSISSIDSYWIPGWREKLAMFFDEEVIQVILTVPLADISLDDTLVWEHHSSGLFTVNSAYHLAKSVNSLPSSSSSNSLLLIFSIRKFCQPLFVLCSKGPKFVTHALLECSRALREWKDSRFKDFYRVARNCDIREYLLRGFQDFSKADLRVFIGIVWEIWNRRNITLFNKRRISFSSAEFQVKGLLQAYDKAQTFHNPNSFEDSQEGSQNSFTPDAPKVGSFKLLVDAAISNQLQKIGIGASVFDSKSDIVATMSSPCDGVLPPLLAKAKALLWVLRWCIAVEFPLDRIETDSQLLVRKVRHRWKDKSPLFDLASERGALERQQSKVDLSIL
ncbi:uncharacterized protein LOC115696532 [Cannabis sativa]|uniref:uncharacterized protein LOC115696532 n=1 Tax=Cannabis sativa TaxID=3483 RepID=UPI0029C9EAD8|nr:uncharacterized protein LOC115696532 [Cannabis sativa]